MIRYRKTKKKAASGRQRFINKDGRINIRRLGIRQNLRRDWYHWLLSLHWTKVFALLGFFYVYVNAVFAILYTLGGDGIVNARPGNFSDAFFFSVQTLATIGYGVMSPKTFYVNCIVTLETVTGMLTFALFTGLIFTQFSRPTASVRFTKNAVIAPHDGIETLMFRVANKRGNQILQAEVRVTLARWEKTLEGERIRKLYDLELIRDRSSFFSLSWTVRHPITKNSPLHGQNPETLAASNTEIAVLLSGTDDIFSQPVYGRYAYSSDEILCDSRFRDLFKNDENGAPYIDYADFDAVVPVISSPKSRDSA